MTRYSKNRFDPFGKGYDYESAKSSGMKPVMGPDGKLHWGSRNPITGQVLKGRRHETWHLHEGAEELLGYESKYEKGKYFSFPKGTRNPPTRKK